MNRKIALFVCTTLVATTIYTHKKAPNTQLQTYADALYAEIERSRTTLLDKYCPNKTKQQQIISEINRYKTIVRAHYRSPKIKGQHDKNIPQNMRAIATQQLRANNIDPSGITLAIKKSKNVLQSFFSTEPITLATAFGPTFSHIGNMIKITTPPKIEFNISELKKCSDDELLFRIAHEVQHLIEFHSVEKMIIKKHFGTKRIENDELYKMYQKTVEKCADLLPSVYNKKIAQATYNTFWDTCLFNFKKHLPFGLYTAPETQKTAVKHILACHC